MNSFSITVDKKRYSDSKKKLEIKLGRTERFLWGIAESRGAVTHIVLYSTGLPRLECEFSGSQETDSELIVKFEIAAKPDAV